MKKCFLTVSALGCVACAFAAEPPATAVVTVDMTAELGPVKVMHAVNGAPMVKKRGDDQKRGNFEEFAAARIPYGRTHDVINNVSGGAHTCDISAVFPDFDADENDLKNYDFVFTDHYLDSMRRAGIEPFFRLGQTIEHGPKKYGVLPPKDFAKWARICEHVIRHYNEGWAWGLDRAATTRNVAWSNQFNVAYWEIWNEPDLDYPEQWKTNPRTWGGSADEFFRFYGVVAGYLKAKFPQLKIGGPAVCGRVDWSDMFLGYCETNNVPLDFFSWHVYARTPGPFAAKARTFRDLLDKHGFTKTESILNEWNYVKGWVDDFAYSLRVESGDLNLKCAAFVASVFTVSQTAPVDMLMYYDARPQSAMNGLFDFVTQWPLKAYYPFYAWSRLRDYGTQVACSIREGTGADSNDSTGFVENKDKSRGGCYFATAAKGKEGSGALFVVRYSDDDNSSETGVVTIRVPGRSLAGARCHLTDLPRTHTEVPLAVNADGSAVLRLQPLSFALVEW